MAMLLNGLILSFIGYFAYVTVGKKHLESANKGTIQVFLLWIFIPLGVMGTIFFLFAIGTLGGNGFHQGYCGF